MPTKVPTQGTRRSGQGVAAPALQKPIVKNFDPPRYPFFVDGGCSPSAGADTTWSQMSQLGYGDDDVMMGPMGEEERMAAEASTEDENFGFKEGRNLTIGFLRDSIRNMLENMSFKAEPVFEENEEDKVTLDEFSTMGGGAVAGYVLPLGASNSKKKKKEGH